MLSPRSTALPGVFALALAALAVAAPPQPAGAQIRRCTAPDGGIVYTDRSCESMGAIETRPPATAAPDSARYRGGCARGLQDLVSEVTAAIDARDTNRLARSYHWTGLSTRNGYAVLARLDAIAQRPLLNVTALRPPASAGAPGASGIVALRIDQSLADGITASSTTFGLRRNMDCWWITL